MDEKVITLLGREEMLQRLLKVDDNSRIQQKFYPVLLESAGQKIVARGVVAMLVLAIHDYVEGLPSIMSNLMYLQAPEFIEALVDDSEVVEQAKNFLQEALTAK